MAKPVFVRGKVMTITVTSLPDLDQFTCRKNDFFCQQRSASVTLHPCFQHRREVKFKVNLNLVSRERERGERERERERGERERDERGERERERERCLYLYVQDKERYTCKHFGVSNVWFEVQFRSRLCNKDAFRKARSLATFGPTAAVVALIATVA